MDPNQRQFILGAVGRGGGHLCAGIPVMQTFYQQMRGIAKFRKWYEDMEDTGFGRMAAAMQRTTGMAPWERPLVPVITQEARLSFYLAFGVSPATQEAIEESGFSFLTDLPQTEHRFVGVPSKQALMTTTAISLFFQ
jgi:hypothetical protein